MDDDQFDEWFDSNEWPHIPFAPVPYELKGADAGFLPDGRRVMIDYGMRGYQHSTHAADFRSESDFSAKS